MTSTPRRRRVAGLSLVEAVVALGLVSLLIGLVFPAVQASRESARRAACLARLGQMGRAINSFAAVHGAYPAVDAFAGTPGGRIVRQYPIQVGLLPYLDMHPLYHAINFEVTQGFGVAAANATAAAQTIGAFLCPSDSRSTAGPPRPISYRTNLGLGEYRPVPPRAWIYRDTGGFAYWSESTPTGEYRDGTAHTLAFAEKSIGSGTEPFRPSRDWFETTTQLVGEMDQWRRLCMDVPGVAVRRTDGGRTWIHNLPVFTGFHASFPPNTSIPDCGSVWAGVIAARSHHPGGVNAVMVDGSAHWFRSGIETAVWRALGTRQGGEVIDAMTWVE